MWNAVVSFVFCCDFCGWCGGLFGIWLELEMPLGVFFLTGSLLPPPTLTILLPPLISTTPDITAMPVKASQNQAGQTISDD